MLGDHAKLLVVSSRIVAIARRRCFWLLRRDPPVATNNGRQRSIAMHREGGVCTIGLREGRYTTELRQKAARVYNCLPLSPKDCHRDQLNISADIGAWIMSWVVTKVIGLAKSHCIW